MNKNANKFLLAGDKFVPELNLGHLGFTYSTRGSITNILKWLKILDKKVT